MATDNRELSHRVFEDLEQQNFNAVNELMEAAYVHHDPQPPPVPSGIVGYKQFVRYLPWQALVAD